MTEKSGHSEIYKEQLSELGRVCDRKTIGTSIEPILMSLGEIKEDVMFPPLPFLLVEENKETLTRYFVVDSWTESDIQVLRDCHFMQNIEFTAHKASEKEIEYFLREEDK